MQTDDDDGSQYVINKSSCNMLDIVRWYNALYQLVRCLLVFSISTCSGDTIYDIVLDKCFQENFLYNALCYYWVCETTQWAIKTCP